MFRAHKQRKVTFFEIIFERWVELVLYRPQAVIIRDITWADAGIGYLKLNGLLRDGP